MKLKSTRKQHQGARAKNLPVIKIDEKNTKSPKVKKRRLTELEKIHENINSTKEFKDLMKVNMIRACREKNSKSILQEEPSCHIRDTFSLKNLNETMAIAVELLLQFERESN